MGGSTSHSYGEGTTHTNAYGGSTSHGPYGGTSHTNAYGRTTSGAAGYGAVHTSAYGASAYHPPDGYYGYRPPAAASANLAAATANAAAADATSAARNAAYDMGAVYGALPTGCVSRDVNGQVYYLCGNTWFQPSYGANGVYYRFVPAP